MSVDKKSLELYAITDRHWLNGASLYDQVEQTILGGATFMQVREKELDKEDFLNEAIEIQRLCKAHHIPFVINDNVEIARSIDADGGTGIPRRKERGGLSWRRCGVSDRIESRCR